MKKKTYKIYTLGCKVNQYDSEALGRELKNIGYDKADQQVDLLVINTCTVTHSALAKNRQMLEKAKRENPDAKIAIVGCMPVNYHDQVESLGVDYIFKTGEFENFVEKLKSENGEFLNSCEHDFSKYKTDRSRYFLKIQDGCQQFCSYCIIPYNRGKLKSRPKQEIIDELKKVVQAGFVEVVLCGIHLGLYGVEKGKGDTLVSLLKELVLITGLEKIRLSSIEITEVNDELIDLLKTNRKLVRHLHIPLQAGCDKILKSMNRPYDTKYFAERVARLRVVAPEVAVTTDVIVGFPGETDADFKKTLVFCQEIDFSKIHVFPFSAHEKTPAYTFADQIKDETKKQRASELQKLSDELEEKYKQSFLGREIEAIIDGRKQKGGFRAKSEYYFDIFIPTDENWHQGQLVKVKNWQLL